jgi:hypothetical protein
VPDGEIATDVIPPSGVGAGDVRASADVGGGAVSVMVSTWHEGGCAGIGAEGETPRMSQIRTVLSPLPETTKRPSEEKSSA